MQKEKYFSLRGWAAPGVAAEGMSAEGMSAAQVTQEELLLAVAEG